MFDQLMNVVRQFGRQSVVENPVVPNQHNEDVMQEAGHSIWSRLKDLAGKGDSDGVASMLRADQDHPAVAETKENFAGNIMHKFGIDSGSAYDVANNLIPNVLRSLVKRPGTTTAAGQGFGLSSILAGLTGNKGTDSSGASVSHPGLLSSIGNKLGLDKDGDGDVDLQDLSKLIH
ncbi:MAG: hypothetical protein ABI581_01405 [Sediminibacterium sp.]